MIRPIVLLTSTVAAAALVACVGACANTDFSSSSKGGGKKGDDGDKSDDATVDQALGQTGESGPSGTGSGGVGTDLAASGGTAQVDQCLTKKADDYNFVLIFDNSGSQMQTDPASVRRDGAILFAEQFQDYVRRNPQARVRIAVISFNTESIRGQRGWIGLTGSNQADVQAEITQATSSPNGGTAYSPALKDAAAYFELVKTMGAMTERARNYVVFLTDGEPNAAGMANFPGGAFPGGFPGGLPGGLGAEQMSDIPAAVNVLVNSYRVAMVTIAAGTGISAEGEQITQSMAEPKVGIAAPDHIGMYRRAASAEELRTVWQGLLGLIGDCQ
jgi:hypothetical protein